MENKKTHWKKLDNPNYLGAYSLMDGNDKDMTVTIEKVVIEDVMSNKGSEQCKVAYLKGLKPMILNATNCKIIERVYNTPYIDDWKGKQITLYVSKIRAFGDTIDALRVRPIKPDIKLPELTPAHDKWKAAKDAIAAGSYKLSDVKLKYTVSPENEKLLCLK
jgi:hypothetical protein